MFARLAHGWHEVAELRGADTVAEDYFGYAVAISGSSAIVGAYRHKMGAGRAYVFTTGAHGWRRVAELKGADTEAGDDFGWSVAISGNAAVVGADGRPAGGLA